MMTNQRAEELINQFKNKKILVIGDIILDHYVFGSVDRLNPEAPVSLLEVKKEINSSGGAGNVAKNAAQLGASTTLATLIGNDKAADELKKAVASEGYTLEAISDPERPTTLKTRFLAGSQQLLRVDHEVRQEASPDRQEELIDLVTRHASEAEAILVSDYAKGAITEHIAQHCLKIAKEHNVPIAVDAKPAHLKYFKGATFMSPNRKEALEALDLVDNKPVEPTELATLFAKEFNTTACITLSADGIIVHGSDQPVLHVPQTHVREVYDVSGAGDTAIVTMLLARLSGGTWEESLQLANAASAVVIAKVGTVGLSSDELHDMICHKHE